MFAAPPLPQSGPLFAALLSAAGLLFVLLYLAWRRRHTPAERERLRRLQVNAIGRITDGTIIEFHGDYLQSGRPTPKLIHYTYTIGGVEYSTAQDVSALLEKTGSDLSRLVGAVTVKYHARNPSNSIVVCRGISWSR